MVYRESCVVFNNRNPPQVFHFFSFCWHNYLMLHNPRLISQRHLSSFRIAFSAEAWLLMSAMPGISLTVQALLFHSWFKTPCFCLQWLFTYSSVDHCHSLLFLFFSPHPSFFLHVPCTACVCCGRMKNWNHRAVTQVGLSSHNSAFDWYAVPQGINQTLM